MSRVEGDWDSNPNLVDTSDLQDTSPDQAGTAGPFEILTSVISFCISLYHYHAHPHSRTWRKYYDSIKKEKKTPEKHIRFPRVFCHIAIYVNFFIP